MMTGSMTTGGSIAFASPEGLWDEAAACLGEDLTLFFAPNYFEKQSVKRAREAKAKLICRSCPVQAECLEYGLASSDGHGVWGGFNEQERRRLLRLRERTSLLLGAVETVA